MLLTILSVILMIIISIRVTYDMAKADDMPINTAIVHWWIDVPLVICSVAIFIVLL